MPFKKIPKPDSSAALAECLAERDSLRTRLPEAKAHYARLIDERRDAMRAGDLNKARTLKADIEDAATVLDVMEHRLEELTASLPHLRGDLKGAAVAEARLRYADAVPDVGPALTALESALQPFLAIQNNLAGAGVAGAVLADFETPPVILLDLSKIAGVRPGIEINPEVWAWLERCDARIAKWKKEAIR